MSGGADLYPNSPRPISKKPQTYIQKAPDLYPKSPVHMMGEMLIYLVLYNACISIFKR